MSNEIESAQVAGVEADRDFAIFQNKGYQGLYGGLGAKEIHARKGLKENEQILDHMGSTELAANLFRATQTDEKLRRENIRGKEKGQSNPLRGWQEGQADHRRAGRHHAGRSADAGKEH